MGPFSDRMALEVKVYRSPEAFCVNVPEMQHQIQTAWQMQRQRYAQTDYIFNADVKLEDMERFCSIEHLQSDPIVRRVLAGFRGMRKSIEIRRLARTIADLAGTAGIEREHFLEAASFRHLRDFSDV